MPPPSIVRFSRLFLISVGFGLINTVLSFSKTQAMLAADPAMAELGFGSGFIISIAFVSLAIPLLLWFFIARRASNLAKWILVVLTALGLLMMPSTLSSANEMGYLWLFMAIAVTAIQLIAIYYLFRADAREWLESHGTRNPVDPGTFD
jgi:hypothetical protein